MRHIPLRVFAFLAPLALVSCTSSPPPPPFDPHAMSAEDNRKEADKESAAAAAHLADYDPNAKSDSACGGGSASSKYAEGPCWTEWDNPTAIQLTEAKAHEKHAAEHRAAFVALVEAEKTACAGLSQHDREMSPFHHTGDIAKVTFSGPAGEETTVTVVFKPITGLTVASLKKIVDCHLARNAALGNVVPEMPYCPLVPKGAIATVSQIDGALAVTVGDADPVARKDVIARAKKLLP